MGLTGEYDKVPDSVSKRKVMRVGIVSEKTEGD